VLKVEAIVATHAGRVRTGNEDTVSYVRPKTSEAITERGCLALLADGMGGNSAGEIASALACKLIDKEYFSTPDSAGEALKKAVESANKAIFELSLKEDDLRGMGTTVVSFAVVQNKAWMAYVGDSRLYLIRDRHIYRMTEDHSVVFELVSRGLLTPEGAHAHPDRNVLSRALGTKAQVEVSCWNEAFAVRTKDRFLLCSDGLHDLVRDEEMLELVSKNDANIAVEKLIGMANERGGHDNISIILVSADEEDTLSRSPMPTTREVILK
jgi:PPM family protein phosphatase